MFNKANTNTSQSILKKCKENIAGKNTTLSVKAFPQLTGIALEKIFSPMSGLSWAMWLDSGNSEHVDSRFDVFVWSPIATLTTQKYITDIHLYENDSECSQHYQSEEDPLILVKTLQEQLFTKSVEKHDFLPFLGGALGYFAYDLGRRFEQLPTLAKQDINLPEMAVGLYNQAIIFDKLTQTFYLVCPESQRSSIEALIISQTSDNKTTEHNETNNAFKLNSAWLSNMDKESYTAKFDAVQDYLLSGDCYQVNLAQRFQASYQGDEFAAYLALRAANKAPFSAFIRLADAAILSISPERFLQVAHNKVQSKPIKGTMPRSTDKAQDLMNAEILKNSSKDKAENLMIVDLLRNDISRSCQAGSVKVPKLFDIESFPAVHHLVSTVEGQLSEDKDVTDLLRGAFPGGSITGAPKIRAMEVIEELEPHQRSIYCGSIGYISTCGTMDTSITIRTLVCQTAAQSESKSESTKPAEAHNNKQPNINNNLNTIFCWAGGGVVADSTAESEYQETFDKVNCILPILSKLNKSE